MLNWKKAKAWIAIPAAVLCAVTLVLTGCDPAASGDSPFGHSYKAAMVVTSTGSDEPIVQDRLFTLTSDMALYVRNSGETAMRGAFREMEVLPEPELLDGFGLKSEIVSAWEDIQNGPGNYLLQMEDGALYLIQGGQMYLLERADLLAVTIRQPGAESYVEPVWYQPGYESWYLGTLSTTLVDDEAEIILTPQTDADKILVSEEYYEVLPGGETNIITTDYFLDPDGSGNFRLNVSKRGSVGDDYAIYRVSMDQEQYLFRLTFPAVPGETSVSITGEYREVSYAENGVYITLMLPESWEYAITTVAEDEYNPGIDFWPMGREEGKLHFGYYPQGFAVCGTGLETEAMTVAGRSASVGTYDGRSLWDFISFGEDFAVWGQGHETWWAEYGGQAMEILNSAQFGK